MASISSVVDVSATAARKRSKFSTYLVSSHDIGLHMRIVTGVRSNIPLLVDRLTADGAANKLYILAKPARKHLAPVHAFLQGDPALNETFPASMWP